MKKVCLCLFVVLYVSAIFADGVEPVGSGTEVDPYQVETLDNLLWVSTNSSSWDKYFIQTADIDASDTQNWNNGEGFSPIGYNPQFSGKYNGNNFTIINLHINRPNSNYIGLFGAAQGSTFENIGLINFCIVGGSNTGILVGFNFSGSSIYNCFSTGNVSGTDAVGGLVGINMENSSIINCYNSASVNGNFLVGGLVGSNTQPGSFFDNELISNCYNTGNVEGNTAVGGLVGESYAIINNCYNLGFVDGNSTVGGLVGKNGYTIDYSFSTGFVSGTNYVGGLVGFDDESTIMNSFWDVETSGQLESEGGTGKTTIEMKDVATFTDLSTIGLDSFWDFVGNPNDDTGNDDYWDIDLAINDGYPYFANPYVNIEENVIPVLSCKIINYPNPFNPKTTISFFINEDSQVEISIYNTKGQKIKTLTKNDFNQGNHSTIWNGDDESGKSVSSGIYFYKLNINGKTEAVKKCLLLK